MNTNFRPPAVPLVTVDPYLSVWSPADALYDDHTVHWTGQRNGMMGMLMIDGVPWRFIGKCGLADTPAHNTGEAIGMAQTRLEVQPLSSTYTFQAGGVELVVDFTTPLLLDELEILSRPASYITFRARAIDGQQHDVKLYFDITGEWCVNTPDQQVTWGRTDNEQFTAMYMGTTTQDVLGHSGDDIRIDWGHVYLAIPSTYSAVAKTVIASHEVRRNFMKDGDIGQQDEQGPQTVGERLPVMATVLDMSCAAGESTDRHLLVAYDDVASIEYFQKPLPAYWRRNGASFTAMLGSAVAEYADIMQRCGRFNTQLLQSGTAAGGAAYAQMLALAYRQAIAAHKLVADENGDILFFSKECFSNGCMATVDVSYPSIPLFLLYNPELIKGMMRPVFRFAATADWKFDFAPHDVGVYPKANGQVYGLNREKKLLLELQMPVEECGNMLIMMAAVCVAEGNADFARDNWALLSKWNAYLVEYGQDPGNQLCTDDFAGHLAHNTNLSVKAIMGVAGYALLCNMLGKDDEGEKCLNTARKMAQKWEETAREGDHYKLTFVDADTWSLKYNMIWDQLFELHLFPEEVKQREVNYYIKQQDRYGIPLDSRRHYTKTDWLVWAASLATSAADFQALIQPLYDFLNASPSRVPFTDWYSTTDRTQQSFQHRSVIGGIFMKLLVEKGLAR
ncbi:glutaminase family protein [Alicyclobacillus fodiniaquatilis]|uniref:Glutaminase domain-containing protein n=1 Tax=Alicyclobacillus fodiniaquatilis TaxID=1661150 RepID=A0ABW4JMC4_9BACL